MFDIWPLWRHKCVWETLISERMWPLTVIPWNSLNSNSSYKLDQLPSHLLDRAAANPSYSEPPWRSIKKKEQQKHTSVTVLQTHLKWVTQTHQLYLFADMPVVSIHLKYLLLIFSFHPDERGASSYLPCSIALVHFRPTPSSTPLTCLSSSVLFVSLLSSSTHLPKGADTTADCGQRKTRDEGSGLDMQRRKKKWREDTNKRNILKLWTIMIDQKCWYCPRMQEWGTK